MASRRLDPTELCPHPRANQTSVACTNPAVRLSTLRINRSGIKGERPQDGNRHGRNRQLLAGAITARCCNARTSRAAEVQPQAPQEYVLRLRDAAFWFRQGLQFEESLHPRHELAPRLFFPSLPPRQCCGINFHTCGGLSLGQTERRPLPNKFLAYPLRRRQGIGLYPRKSMIAEM